MQQLAYNASADYYLFADLSSARSQDIPLLDQLIKVLVVQSDCFVKVISVSSGVEHLDFNDIIRKKRITNCLRNGALVEVTGFTEIEATNYVEMWKSKRE